MHPDIERALNTDAVPCFATLAIRASDVNELCQGFKDNFTRLGLAVARAIIDIDLHLEAGAITQGQRDRLIEILKDGLEEEEAQILKFPSPGHEPPRRSA